jgi:hypothetical protein
MRDLEADWRRWSLGERISAVALLISLGFATASLFVRALLA